jgi:hypothetical protein
MCHDAIAVVVVCDTCYRKKMQNTAIHGVAQYNRGCRCESCILANSEKLKRDRQKHGEARNAKQREMRRKGLWK